MKKFFIIGGIIVVIIITVILKFNHPNAIEVKVAKVSRGTVSKFLDETGTVKSKEQRIVNSKAAGEIDKVNVEEGSVVKKGDILASINSEKIDFQIKALNEQINNVKASYQEALKPADQAKIQQAEANVSNAKIDLDEAKRLSENSKKLYENGSISYEEYKNSLNNVSVKQNLLVIAQQNLTMLKTGVSSNVKEQFESQIAQLQYQKDILVKNKQDLTITAPIAGTITDVYIKEGSYVQPGIKLFEIGNNKSLYLESEILASDIQKIKVNGLVDIIDEDLNINSSGTVEKIFPKAFSKISDLGIEQKRVKVNVNIPQNLGLKIGYEVDAKFLLEKMESVLYVPDNSIFDIDNVKHVFVVKDNVTSLRKVETGLEGDDYTEIISGLKVGEQVIISPDTDLKEGVAVKTT